MLVCDSSRPTPRKVWLSAAPSNSSFTLGPACLVPHGGPGLHHGVYRGLDPLAKGRTLVYWDLNVDEQVPQRIKAALCQAAEMAMDSPVTAKDQHRIGRICGVKLVSGEEHVRR